MHNDDCYYLLSLPLSWEDSDKFTKDSSYSDDVLLQIKAKQKKKMMILKVKKRRRLKKCSICKKSFAKNKFKFHLFSHSNKMIYHCKYCKIKFAQHETYVQHLSLHDSKLTDTNPHVYSKTNYYYRCNLCDKQFRKKSEYRSHLIVHNDESRLNKEQIKGCTNLLKGEDQESNITHMNIHTSDTIENDCRNLVYLKNRNNSENNLYTKKSSKSFSCNFCKKSFNNLSHMLQHVRIHTGEKPYKCHICGVAFLQSGHFHKHMRSHGHSKPFQCENCSKRFSSYTKFQFHSSSQCLDGTVPDIESKTQNARYAKDTATILNEKFKCLVVVHKMEVDDSQKNLHFVDDYDDYINNNSTYNSYDMKKFDMNYRMDNGDDVIDRSHDISSRYHKVIGSGIENDDGQLNVNHDIKCKLCSKPFLHKRNIYRHMRVVHGISDALSTLREGNFDKKVNNVSDKDRIVKNCSYPLNVNQQYMCDICDKTFAYRNNVIKHKRVVHKIFDLYSCKQCSLSFSTYKEWNLHNKGFHGIHTSVANCYNKHDFNKQMKSYECRLCNHKFNFLGNYKKHIKTYRHKQRLKEYIVQQKEKISSLTIEDMNRKKYPLRKRINYGNENKLEGMNRKKDPFHKKINSHNSLNLELLSNVDGKLTCNICHKQYLNEHTLKKHSLLHGKLKKIYSCIPCEQKFNDFDNYKKHLETLVHQRNLKVYSVQQKEKKSYSICLDDSLQSVSKRDVKVDNLNRKRSHSSTSMKFESKDDEKVTVYSCELCDHKSNLLGNYKKHLQTIKHQRRYKEYIAQQKKRKLSFIPSEDSLVKISQKGVNRKSVNSDRLSKFELQSNDDEKVMKYSCKPCDHKFNHLGNYKQHLKTLIHQRRRREYVAQQKKQKFSSTSSKDSLKKVGQKGAKRKSVNPCKLSTLELQSNEDEKVTVYSCELCDHKSNLLGNYKKHLQTIKHQKRYREYIAQQKKRKLSFIPSKDSPKNVSQKGVNSKSVNSTKLSKFKLQSIVDEKVMKYSCKPCNHKFNHLGNYKQHLKTLIHQRRRREYVAQQKKRKYSSIPLRDSLAIDSKEENECISSQGRRFLKNAINKQILKFEAGVKDCSITVNNFTNL